MRTPSINDIDEMLAERVAARVAAGPMWPMQAEPVWRDGDTYLRRRRGDKLVTLGPDLFTNRAEMAAIRPPLPELLPLEIAERIAVFDQLLDVAQARTHRSVTELTGSTQSWIDTWNDDPKPFVWTKTAEEILDRIAAYCRRISESAS